MIRLPLFGKDSLPQHTSSFLSLIITFVIWMILFVVFAFIKIPEKEEKYKPIQIVFEQPKVQSVKEKTELSLTEEEKEIVTALSDGQKHIEKLAVITGKQAYILTPLLSVLEIKGVVVRSGNIYGLNRNDLEA